MWSCACSTPLHRVTVTHLSTFSLCAACSQQRAVIPTSVRSRVDGQCQGCKDSLVISE